MTDRDAGHATPHSSSSDQLDEQSRQGLGDAYEYPPQHTEEPQDTQEFVALLPDEVTQDLDLGTGEELYPPPVDAGVAPTYPDPVHYGKDWRLLLPADTDTYQEAVQQPVPEDDAAYSDALHVVSSSLLRRRT
jgi:hypothetical protein